MFSSVTAFLTAGRYRPGPTANWDHVDDIAEIPDELAYPPPAYFRHRHDSEPPTSQRAFDKTRLATPSDKWQTYERSADELEALKNTYENSLHPWMRKREAELLQDNIDLSSLLIIAYRELYRVNSELERLERMKSRQMRPRFQREDTDSAGRGRHSFTGVRETLGGL